MTMTDDRRLNAPPALPPQMTVGQYVRENFKTRVRPYVGWFAISAPVFGAVRIRESGFEWGKLALIPVAWAIACLLACLVAVVALAAAGWWKLHMKLSPYVPVTILLVAAVLGYVWVFNFY